jgi:hypothetical protein
MGKGRGCVFGSSPKWFEQPHPELVHWWLLVHSSPNNGPKNLTCQKLKPNNTSVHPIQIVKAWQAI